MGKEKRERRSLSRKKDIHKKHKSKIKNEKSKHKDKIKEKHRNHDYDYYRERSPEYSKRRQSKHDERDHSYRRKIHDSEKNEKTYSKDHLKQDSQSKPLKNSMDVEKSQHKQKLKQNKYNRSSKKESGNDQFADQIPVLTDKEKEKQIEKEKLNEKLREKIKKLQELNREEDLKQKEEKEQQKLKEIKKQKELEELKKKEKEEKERIERIEKQKEEEKRIELEKQKKLEEEQKLQQEKEQKEKERIQKQKEEKSNQNESQGRDKVKEKDKSKNYSKEKEYTKKNKEKSKLREREKSKLKDKDKDKDDKDKDKDKDKENDKNRKKSKQKREGSKNKESKKKEAKKKHSKSKKKSRSRSRGNSLKQDKKEEQTQEQKEDQLKKLRLAKARLLKFKKSDDEHSDENGEYEDPQPLDPDLPEEIKVDDWTKNRKKKDAKAQDERMRKAAKLIMYDSDGLEGDENDDDNSEKQIMEQSQQIQEEESKNNQSNTIQGNEKHQIEIEKVEPVKKEQQEAIQKTRQTCKIKSIQEIRRIKEERQRNRGKYVRQRKQEKMDDEEDPLDAFMKSVQDQAVKQESFSDSSESDEKSVKDKGKVEEQTVQIDEQKIITMDAILNHEQNGNHNQKDREEEDDDDWYQIFMRGLKQKEHKEKFEVSYIYLVIKFQMEEEEEEQGYGNDQAMQLSEDEPDYLDKQKKLQEKKELKPVDHSQIQYQAFKKCFYREIPELSKLTPKQVDKIRHDMGDIKVRGKDVPNPILNWYQSGLNDKILTVLIDKKKFEKPFPIQAQALPSIMSGRDFIGIAETGSGKTLAFLLPLFRHVLDQQVLKEGDGPIGLILAPTRELAHQIYVDGRSFANALNMNIVCCVGGAGIAGQLSDLKRGAEIVVCTPGRMIDVLTTSNGKVTNLKRVTYVVIDEADRMFDLGFEPQIYKILANIRPDRQMLMFSATFPKNVEMLAKKALFKPIECIVGGRGQAGGNIEQRIEFMEDHDRLYKLLIIFQEWYDKGSILVFVDKQSEADELFKELMRYGYKSLVLHGGMDSQDREFTIHDFKKGIKSIMVATSVCARGLDIKSVILVVNFQCPNHMEDYIHRIGRTGRAGNKGTAITFFTPNDEQYASDLIYALDKSGQKVPDKLREHQKSFANKVKQGGAKIFHNRNRQGTGFKFNEEEREKMKQMRAAIRKQLGQEANIQEDESSDDEEFFNKISKVNKMSDSEKKKLQEEKEKAEKDKIMELIKDPSLKEQILSEATRAANQCINQGGSRDQVNQTAIDAIKRVLKAYSQASKSAEAGIEEAIQIINEFEERERINQDFVSYDFEINDYPPQARQKICSKEFLNMIHELTNCTILQRGTYIEPTKKVLPGQRKLFLRIEGESEYYVLSAYKEIKRMGEDMTMKSIQQAYQQTGQF